MPSNKTLTIFVLCLGIVVSVWLITKKTEKASEVAVKTSDSASVEPVINIEKSTNDDWKKILTSVSTKNQKIVDLSKNNDSGVDDSTLTDQMSRDFLSQYLMAVKDGTKITPEVASKIAQNTLSLPEYNKSDKALYSKLNLIITSKKDKVTITKYKDAINKAIKSVYFDVKDDPMAIVISAMQKENQEGLKQLDPIIAINKQVIKDLLSMEVPEGAVGEHLDILNSSARLLNDLESMRVAVSDPVGTFSAIGQYSIHLNDFGISLYNMDLYLLKNTI